MISDLHLRARAVYYHPQSAHNRGVLLSQGTLCSLRLATKAHLRLKPKEHSRGQFEPRHSTNSVRNRHSQLLLNDQMAFNRFLPLSQARTDDKRRDHS
jgi:hypothetical protein